MKPNQIALMITVIAMLGLAAFAGSNSSDPSATAQAEDLLAADNPRKNRRDDRQEDRPERRDDRRDCRQDDGRVGNDKRDCKQDQRDGDEDIEADGDYA